MYIKIKKAHHVKIYLKNNSGTYLIFFIIQIGELKNNLEEKMEGSEKAV